jgi:hypothetical protein
MARLLMTVPGIGYYSALLIVSEIGDIHRFPDSCHLCSYAGLIPSTRSSGGTTYHGSITKTGSKYLRWIMLECLHAHIRNEKNSNVTQFYHRLSKKKGNSKAAVAAASKLVKIVYWIMKVYWKTRPIDLFEITLDQSNDLSIGERNKIIDTLLKDDLKIRSIIQKPLST